MKMIMYVAGAVILVVTLVAGCGYFSHRGDGRFCDRGFHPRFQRDDFHDHVLKRMDQKVEKLNLNEDQQTKYQEIRQRIATDMAGMKEGRKVLFSSLQEELERERPDIDALAGLFKEKLGRMPGLMENHLDAFVEFYQILDQEQQDQIIEHFREKLKKARS